MADRSFKYYLSCKPVCVDKVDKVEKQTEISQLENF